MSTQHNSIDAATIDVLNWESYYRICDKNIQSQIKKCPVIIRQVNIVINMCIDLRSILYAPCENDKGNDCNVR